jgi:hypothetical protein
LNSKIAAANGIHRWAVCAARGRSTAHHETPIEWPRAERTAHRSGWIDAVAGGDAKPVH